MKNLIAGGTISPENVFFVVICFILALTKQKKRNAFELQQIDSRRSQRTLSLSIGQGFRRAFSDLSNGMPSERVFLKSSAAKTNPVHGLSSTGSWIRIKAY